MRRSSLRAALAATALAALVALSGCVGGGEAPRNIVLLIGDGMGAAHVTAAKIAFGDLEMERLTHGGLCTTFAEDELVTDSAASGTALATGVKSYNGAISVTSGQEVLKTAVEYAEENGMATGLVATCSITHATPAVFASHVDDRGKDFEIAEQLAASDVDVMFGGGFGYFIPNTSGGMRSDGQDLLAGMEARMVVARTIEEFEAMGTPDAAAFLYTQAHPGRAATRPVSLAEFSRRALDILSKDEDGFFLMIEGSQIDWAGHENSKPYLLAEMADFDEAVGIVLDFAELDGETLVIVTADHETGALYVDQGSAPDEWLGPVGWGSDRHTAAMVPVLTYGPGAEALGGIIDNTDIGEYLIGLVSGR